MKNLILFLCLVVLVVGALTTDWQEQSAPPPAAPPKAAPAETSDAQPAAPQAPRGEWPYVDAQSEAEVAEELLTRNVVLIYDSSGSMDNRDCTDPRRKYQVAQEAIAEWAQSLPVDANLGLVAFHGRWTTAELSRGEREKFVHTLAPILPNGPTPLTQAFRSAYKMLTAQAKRQLGYGDYTIVVITDGEAHNMQTLAKVVDEILATTPITVYTIGFCIGKDHSLNQPGRTIYKPADNMEELRKGLAQAIAEADTFDLSAFE